MQEQKTIVEEIFERCPYQNREEWLKLRGRGIGGSDAAAILGYSQWMTSNDLWRKKVYGSDYEDAQNEDNEFIKYGNAVEDALRTLFQAKFVDFLEVYKTDEVLVRKDKPYLRASLDGEIRVLQDFIFKSADDEEYMLKKGMRGIWENKTAYRPPKDKWDKKIPMNYFCQILHYLNVTGYDFVIVSVEISYQGGASSIKHFVFKRQDKILDLEYLERKEDEFWEKVEKKIEVPTLIKF